VKLPVNKGSHEGKSIDIGQEAETITILGADGKELGALPWESVIDYVLAATHDARMKKARKEPRVPLSVKVWYRTPDGKHFESLTEGIGGGGLFIESSTQFPPGTEIEVEFSLPDKPTERLRAKGEVVWVRTKPERYTFFPGMGVKFTEIPESARGRVVELVQTLEQSRQVH
jgi:type IV pilus assembly protein PilZ